MRWFLCSILVCAWAALGESSRLQPRLWDEDQELVAELDQFDDNDLKLLVEWENYKYKYNKRYQDVVEERQRLMIYRENGRRVEEHNADYERGLTTYTMELNQFADMTEQEFINTMTGNDDSDEDDWKYVTVFRWNNSLGKIPASMDWRKHGAVTAVKNQGYCASCWAFSATGALEGQQYLNSRPRRLVSLSEQNLMDCSTSYQTRGCNGGTAVKAFNYIKNNRGIDTENSYPYEAKIDTCRYKPKNRGAMDAGVVFLAAGEQKLMENVASMGPVSVSIDSRPLHFYKSGVLYNSTCSSSYHNHAVLVVGYGEDKAGEYWLVKNSWGWWWGEDGYFRLARNRNNHCGIASRAVLPLV